MVAIKKAPEALDHELNRLPVTRTMWIAVTNAAAAAELPVTIWLRQAIREKLASDQAK